MMVSMPLAARLRAALRPRPRPAPVMMAILLMVVSVLALSGEPAPGCLFSDDRKMSLRGIPRLPDRPNLLPNSPEPLRPGAAGPIVGTMTDPLASAVARFADSHTDGEGIAHPPVSGLTLIRASAPSALQYAISNPMVVL